MSPGNKKVPISAYFHFLKSNAAYRRLLAAELINQGGNWLSYVSCLQLATTLMTKKGVSANENESSGVTVALVLISKLLPSFVLFPVAGAAADLYDRPSVMTASCIVCAFFVAILGFIAEPSQLLLMYLVLVIVNSSEAFYEPARRALVPLICKREELQLATSLDSLAWSFMAAFGASVGGYANSKLGMRACFLLDSLTFFTNAIFVRSLVVPRPLPTAPTALSEGAFSDGSAPGGSRGTDAAEKGNPRPPRLLVGQEGTGREGAFSRTESPPLPSTSVEPGRGSDRRPYSAWGALADAGRKMREGWHFISAKEHRDIAFMCTAKAWGGLLWGFADLVAVRFSHERKFQGLGDASQTMGFIFGAVGLGCILGPLVANAFTRPDSAGFLRGIAWSFVCLNVGYLLMALAPDIYLLMVASALRAQGSTVLWSYSTLILQLRVTNDILGRVSALELAIYYLLECASGLASGILFDAFRISPSTACLWISALALVPSVLWLGVAAHLGPRWAREHEGLTFASSSSAGPLPSPSESSHRAALNLVGGSGVALAGSANGPAGGPALGEGVALARTTSSDVALLIKGAA